MRATKGPSRRVSEACRACAISSLPVPVSPQIKTVEPSGPTCLIKVEDAPHLRAFRDDVVKFVVFAELEAKLLQLVDQTALINGASDQQDQAGRVARPGHEIVGAGLHSIKGELRDRRAR